MASKFMRIKRIVVPMLTIIIVVSQLTGCSIMSSNEMIDMINAGQTITIELAKPSYDIVVKGQQESNQPWIQLDQLKEFNTFRQDFDTLFNINIISENNIDGKSGCLFVDESNDRNGNTTLEDSFRNKSFIEKYWNNPDVSNRLTQVVSDVYTDVDENSPYALMASLNAYYNLLRDNDNPESFNGSQSLIREEFYTLVFKASEGVRPIETDKSFEQAIGGPTELSKYAQAVANDGFLDVSNNSLDATSYKGSISIAEAVYMVVHQNFADQLSKVDGREKAFKDTKNAGDLALKVGFKEKKDGKIISKDRWQSYTLAYAVKHPDKGLPEELYKPMVVAKELGLIDGDESHWDEPLSKGEGLQLLINTYLAKNKLYGYQSTVEYGNKNPNKFNVSTEDSYPVLGVDPNGLKYGSDWTEVPQGIFKSDPNKQLSSGLTLGQAKEKIDKIKEAYEQRGYAENTINSLLEQEAKLVGATLDELNHLPSNTVVAADKGTDNGAKPKEEPKPGDEETLIQNTQSNNGSSGNWNDLPDVLKNKFGAPDGSDLSLPDLSGVHNPFK